MADGLAANSLNSSVSSQDSTSNLTTTQSWVLTAVTTQSGKYQLLILFGQFYSGYIFSTLVSSYSYTEIHSILLYWKKTHHIIF